MKKEESKGEETVGEEFEKILEVNEQFKLLILSDGSGQVTGTLDQRNPVNGP